MKQPKVRLLSLAIMAIFSQGAFAQVSQLDNIVVTASGFEQAVEDAPASISVIPRKELEKKAYKDVTDALKDVPGVVVTGGGSHSDISIRGMGSAYTLILVDGKRQNSRETRPNSDGPGIEQGWLPPLAAIERIEVVRGPMSSLYGSEAMGGVINIITRKVQNEWTGSITAEGTYQEDRDSGDIYQGSFYLAGPIKEDKLGIQIYGQQSHRKEDHIEGGYNYQDVKTSGVKLTLTPNKNHDIIAEASRSIQTRASTPGKSVAVLNNRGKPNEYSESKYGQNNFSLTHNGRWGWATSNTYIQRSETSNPVRDMYLDTTEFNTNWSLPLGSHVLTTGLQYLDESLKDEGNKFDYGPSTITKYRWALYAEDEWFMSDSFSLTTGVRLNHDELFGNHWTPRIYGVWHATEQLSFKGGVSTGFKAPSLRQTVTNWGQATGGPGGNQVIIGNPDLKPEKSITEEIGLIWDNRDNFNASLTLFNTQFKDKISEVILCDNCTAPGDSWIYDKVRTRTNVDRAIMRGIEATATWSILDNLRLASNYTYTYSKQKSGKFAGQPLNQMPKHMFNTTLDWDINNKLNTWARLNFRSRTSDYLSRTDMAEGTPSYAFTDLGLNYQINKNTKVGVAVYNIFNKRIPYADYGTILDGRRYWAQLTVGF